MGGNRFLNNRDHITTVAIVVIFEAIQRWYNHIFSLILSFYFKNVFLWYIFLLLISVCKSGEDVGVYGCYNLNTEEVWVVVVSFVSIYYFSSWTYFLHSSEMIFDCCTILDPEFVE